MDNIRVWRSRGILPPKPSGWKKYGFPELVMVACLVELKSQKVDVRWASGVLYGADLTDELKYRPNRTVDGKVHLQTANDKFLFIQSIGIGPDRKPKFEVVGQNELKRRILQIPKACVLQVLNISEIRRLVQLRVDEYFGDEGTGQRGPDVKPRTKKEQS